METSTTTAETPPAPSGNGSGPVDSVAALAALDGTAGRRRWPALLVGIAVGIGGTVAASALLDGRSEADDTEAATVELATASVEQRDLVEEIEWAGTLGYGETAAVSGSGGTITEAVAVGSTVERGDVVVTVDAQPVVALYGQTPMWRSLTEGDSGVDVLQLEANLAALGHDPDRTVDVDGTFTANTAAMVERWQEDVGLEVTGSVALGSVVIIEGPSVVSSVADVGSPASGPLAVVAPRSAVIDVVAGIDGPVTAPAAVGTAVEHGTVLFRVDDVPVVALDAAMVGLDPVAAALTDPTFTEVELEQALADGGYDPEEEMTVDGVVTDATRAAIERWQGGGGLPVTGQSDPGYYLALPAGTVVGERLVDDGEDVITGGPVLTLSASRLAAEVTVDVADADEFEVGDEVTIELADETTATGVVSAVGPVVQPADPQGSPTVDIAIGVTVEPGTDPVEGPVTVISAGDVFTGATVVPTRALISLSEGGFAVEKVGPDGSTRLVGIDIGSFDDGVVEVVDGDLVPGDDVVVPR